MIQRHHHITLCVGTAREDFDFHTRVLGLRCVKKTALYDGQYPVYHLYYGNGIGTESTLVTCFPMRQSGRMGRRGNGEISTLSLAIPESGLTYWKQRLAEHGLDPVEGERFGAKELRFQHPCGIPYTLTAVPHDDRTPWTEGGVPEELAIRGTHGISVRTAAPEPMEEFLSVGWSAHSLASDGATTRYQLEQGGAGRFVDLVRESAPLEPATWTFGEGTIHHCAFQVSDFEAQDAVKAGLEALGYTDVSERKDRGYFYSIYVRTPSGALFEAAVSKPEGFLIDEEYERLGQEFQVPPVFADRRDEILAFLEPL